jgi:hypothetical protein
VVLNLVFNHIKEKFNISENKINDLLKIEVDLEELFTDYETIYLQIEKYKSDREMHADYQTLLKELEEEINRHLSNHK